MRILYCNKYNFPFSGTEVYMFEIMDLMRAQGHDVALFSMADPRGQATPYDEFFVPNIDFKKSGQGLFARAKLAAHAIYSTDARRRLRRSSLHFVPTSPTCATSITIFPHRFFGNSRHKACPCSTT